jgi:hypothetical protein
MQRQEASQQDSEGYNMTSPLQNEIKQVTTITCIFDNLQFFILQFFKAKIIDQLL